MIIPTTPEHQTLSVELGGITYQFTFMYRGQWFFDVSWSGGSVNGVSLNDTPNLWGQYNIPGTLALSPVPQYPIGYGDLGTNYQVTWNA